MMEAPRIHIDIATHSLSAFFLIFPSVAMAEIKIASTERQVDASIACAPVLPEESIGRRLSGSTKAWKEDADAGSAEAMLRLANGYLNGVDGLRRDPLEAARWFQRGADLGEPLALLGYAYSLAEGACGVRNPELAREIYLRLEAQGYARAYYLHSLLEAKGATAEHVRSERELLGIAADMGDGFAQNALGVAYERQGDRTTARMWFRQAVAHGSRAAADNLSRLDKLEGGASRTHEQLQLLADQARAGDPIAQFQLARRLHVGDGVPVQYSEALRYYRRSAAQGYAPAERILKLILSKPRSDGQLDPDWMRQVASADVGGIRGAAQAAGVVASKLDSDPLFDLLQLKPIMKD